MELETNARGNLILPASRFGSMVQSLTISAAILYGTTLLKGFDLFEILPPVAITAGFLILFAVLAQVIFLLQGDLEFDSSRQLVVKGGRVVTKFQQIRQVEIQRGTGDEPRYNIVLRLGASRSYVVFGTQDETKACLDAAAIARVINKPVVVD